MRDGTNDPRSTRIERKRASNRIVGYWLHLLFISIYIFGLNLSVNHKICCCIAEGIDIEFSKEIFPDETWYAQLTLLRAYISSAVLLSLMLRGAVEIWFDWYLCTATANSIPNWSDFSWSFSQFLFYVCRQFCECMCAGVCESTVSAWFHSIGTNCSATAKWMYEHSS